MNTTEPEVVDTRDTDSRDRRDLVSRRRWIILYVGGFLAALACGFAATVAL